MLRKLLFLSVLSASILSNGWALPVLNENVANHTEVNIYPDHINPNQFYIAPNRLIVTVEDGVPQFSYSEFFSWTSGYSAIIQTTMTTRHLDVKLTEAIEDIKASNPDAKFSNLPFIESKVVFNTDLIPLIERSFCNNRGASVGSEVACSFTLNRKGVSVLRKQFKEKLTIVFSFDYRVSGVIKNPDETFSVKEINHGVAARLGSKELAKFPYLFKDSKGRTIRF